MDYLTNIINIIKPPGEITTIDNQVIIEYLNIKLVHLVVNKQVEISSTDYLSFHILRLIINKLGLNSLGFYPLLLLKMMQLVNILFC